MPRNLHRSRHARAYSLLLIVTLAATLALIPAVPARAATRNVDINHPMCNDGTGAPAYCHIQPAITAAVSNDTINIAAGMYVENLNVTKNLTLSGAGAGATIIDGNHANRVVTVSGIFTVSISGVTIRNGNASTNGGGIFASAGSTTTLNNSIVSANTAADGGGIYSIGTLTLNNSVITGNQTTEGPFNDGGGIYSSNGTLTLNNSTVSNNTADSSGGGISGSGSNLTLSDSTVSDNTAVDSFSGGIDIETGSLMLTNSSVSGNAAANGYGGGIRNNAGAVSLTNSTVSDNRSGRGGGFFAENGGTIILTSSTVSGNTAIRFYGGGGSGGGISSYSSTITMTNSILAGNTSSNYYANCEGTTITSQGFNLVGDVDGCTLTPTTGDKVGTPANPIDPRLGGLKNNGGTTDTSAPQAASPALDAIPNGTNGCGTTITADQRNVIRPQGAGCEIGAYEANGTPARLVFVTEPEGGPPNTPFPTQPLVGVQDNLGNGVGYSGAVTLALKPGAGPTGATLNGTRSVNAVRGAAQFTNLSIDKAGTGYQLSATGGSVTSADSAPLSITAPAGATPNEAEPNNRIEQANLLAFDPSGRAAIQGKISSTVPITGDVDIYSFTTRPGATAVISLTNLPADYDIALLSDPRVTIPLSDSIDLGKIADISQDIISQDIISQDIISQDIISQDIVGAHLNSASARRGASDETINAFLPIGGQYFIVVFGHSGAFNNTKSYRLAVTLRDGALEQSAVRARSIATLNLTADPAVTTIYLYDSKRMADRFPGELTAVTALTATLKTGSPLLAANSAIGKGKGAGIDLSAALQPADANALTALYNLWDAAPDQPLRANEVAQQIFNILNRAITSYYRNTTDIVIVGGDAIIPFYRVPDETQFGNESQYAATLRATGAAKQNSALDGSLFYHFIQTDNFYADRDPTPWRGRALYLPDMGIGRLVEHPTDIMHYLNGYLASSDYTIDASTSSGAALVTGYSFLTDQANAIANTLKTYGFNPNGTLGTTNKLSTLINDTWGLNQFTNLWFSGKLPQLTGSYIGTRTFYSLTSLNGHFSHYAAIPTNLAGGTFSAERILTPTAQADAQAFFKINGAPTLLYSIGCHSGMNADDGDFTTSALRADFPQAILKQGGNWIGNTGYGYGDTDVIGYSERLSLLFTNAIGRQIKRGPTYVGAPVGESLARAKRQYLKTSGVNSFSVTDEKVLEELTLYGLPFLRVKVPKPTPPALDDPPPAPIPQSIRATLAQPGASGVFTRLITVTNSFAPLNASGLVGMTKTTVQDNFNNTTLLTGTQQTAIGRPVLPLLTYDITLKANPDPLKPGSANGIPIPRGVRLKSATILPDLANFDPHITTMITDQINLQPVLDPSIRIRGAWLPPLPYTFQRTAYLSTTQVITTDKLLVIPAQFTPTSDRNGRLRRFTQMVFEVTYMDPRSAPAAVRAAASSPVFDDARAMPLIVSGGLKVRLSASARDTGGRGLQRVSATYTIDGAHWQRISLIFNATTGRYEATVALLQGGNIYAFIEALDNAGNATIETGKGTLFALNQIFLPPIISR
jgi:hypothetical protein